MKVCAAACVIIVLVLLLALAILLAPLAGAQQPEKLYRIAILSHRSAPDAHFEAFRRGLQELGYREGQNLEIEYRWAAGNSGRLPELAAELVRLKPDVLFAGSTRGALAAKNATATVPIVFAGVGDPVGAGVVSNLARPGGNVTGRASMAVDLAGKALDLLKETVPRTTRVAVLASSTNPTTALKLRVARVAAPPLGVRLHIVDVRCGGDFEAAFSEILGEKPDALLALLDTLTFLHRKEIAAFALKNRLPAIYEVREFVDAGGMMSYGTDFAEMYRQAAIHVDKILKGAKPGELPIEQPTKFELVVNLKAARALGLTIPRSVLLRADQVIE